MKELETWLHANGLVKNTNKTVAISFTCNTWQYLVEVFLKASN